MQSFKKKYKNSNTCTYMSSDVPFWPIKVLLVLDINGVLYRRRKSFLVMEHVSYSTYASGIIRDNLQPMKERR